MTYEICKQIKDAGFPQRFKMGSYYAEKDLSFKEAQKAHFFLDERMRGTPETELEVKKLIAIPLLSELIEACGEMFINLNHDTALKEEWFASGCDDVSAFGSTPEEAVANLWLEINKK